MEEALTKKELKIIEEVVEKVFSLLEISATFTLEEKGEGVDVLVETQDTGIIIGYHGEMLESLQLVISLIVSKKVGRFIRISIEVDEYKKNRTEQLERLAMDAKEKALEENQEQVLSSLKSWERRIVHMFLKEDDQVISESAGEGKERVLIVKPKA